VTGSLLIDGHPATPDDLAHQALVNYGAYTSFRVEGGAARGLDRHLARLEQSALALFGEAVSEGRLRDLMRIAVADREVCWLRVSLFSPAIGHRDPGFVGAPRVMTAVFDPPPPLAGSVRLMTLDYEREAPELKHAATFGLMRARRAARAAGFDDALFLDRDGRISEGSLWNIGFVRGETVIWPQAPMLAGVTQAILQDGLAEAGVSQQTRPVSRDDLLTFDGAFICNSATPAASVTAIDGVTLAEPADLVERLRGFWAAAPLQPI
jgi:branched-subunit amino acid aminotransferase/4-amino-4-deoxychorismate lyase